MKEDLGALNLIELLDRLEPVEPPPPVPLWPQTEAWFVIAAVLLASSIWLFRRLRAHRRAEAYRRAALDALAASDGSPAELAEVLRRTALAAYPRDAVAGLHGEAWLAFLERTAGRSGSRDGDAFDPELGRLLVTTPYSDAPLESDEAERLRKRVTRWVRRHDRTAGAES